MINATLQFQSTKQALETADMLAARASEIERDLNVLIHMPITAVGHVGHQYVDGQLERVASLRAQADAIYKAAGETL